MAFPGSAKRVARGAFQRQRPCLLWVRLGSEPVPSRLPLLGEERKSIKGRLGMVLPARATISLLTPITTYETQDMTKLPRDDDGLTPQESQAAVLRATGMSQAEAWRQAFNRPRVKPQTAWTEASKVFSRPKVSQRVSELLKTARIEDIDSVGAAFDDLLRLLTKAEDEGNLTAAANLMRQRLQAHGILRDRVTLTLAETTSDADLIEQLSGGDVKMAAALRAMLGAAEGFGETRH